MCKVALAGECVDCCVVIQQGCGRGRPIKRCDECRRLHLKAQSMARRGTPRKTSKYPLAPCCNCGKKFLFLPDCNVDFCKMACKLEWNKKQKQHTCQHCGVAFERQARHTSSSKSKDSLRFCSRKCGRAAVLATTEEERSKGRLVKSLATWFHGWEFHRLQDDSRRSNLCKSCGSQCGSSTYCSKACRRKTVAKPCCVCGNEAIGPIGFRTVCDECKQASKKRARRKGTRGHRERCKRYSVTYDHAVSNRAVFDRDGYRCQLCGEQTLRQFARDIFGVPLPLSPTVDHVVPLHWKTKGHTWDNVRLCCWNCNCIVRNKEGHAETIRKRRRTRKTRSVA